MDIGRRVRASYKEGVHGTRSKAEHQSGKRKRGRREAPIGPDIGPHIFVAIQAINNTNIQAPEKHHKAFFQRFPKNCFVD
jgi:hypothetical protein